MDTEFGVFVGLDEPTKAMVDEALSHGMWTSEFDGEAYPRIQILSAQNLVEGKPVCMPNAARTTRFAKPPREVLEGMQGTLRVD